MIKGRVIKESVQAAFSKIFKSYGQRRLFWGALFFIAILLIVGLSVMPEHINMQEGEPSPRDFDAPRNLTFESSVLTLAARQEAANKVEHVYRTDETVLLEMEEEINGYFSTLWEIRGDEDLAQAEKIEKLKEEFGISLSQDMYSKLISMEDAQLERLQNESIQVLRQIMLPGVLPSDIELTKKNVMAAITLLTVNDTGTSLLASIMESIDFKGNRIYDPIATAQLKEKAMDNIAPVVVKISKNQKIIGKGEIVTAEQLEILEKMGILTSSNPAIPFMGVVILAAIFCAAIVMYLYQYRRHLLEKEALFVLVGLLIVSTLLITRAVTAINLGGRSEIAMLVAYMAPIAAGSMLIAILFDGKLSMFLTTLLAVLVGVMNGIELQFTLVAFIGGMAGIYSVSKLSQRSDLVKASLYIMGANVITILSLGLILNYSLTVLSISIMLGIVNGILSSILTIGSLPFWETAFGITTSVKLLELSNPNQPLLRRLLLEAPGTYHHSVVVGNLAEAAANSVGADALLTRVGANYHDIGKVKRPYFFIENQFTTENPHDKLAPTLSTLIITSHVKDGVELAKEHGIPESIIDIIQQHHGTSILSFFYHKAKEAGLGDTCHEADFRYDYSKPRTKEAAIVMLADNIEAGVRSMQKPTPNKIEAFVRKVIKDKLEDGQLEECDLTFKELDIIVESFVKVLSGIFHSRIEYPESVLKEMERGRMDGGVCKQSAG